MLVNRFDSLSFCIVRRQYLFIVWLITLLMRRILNFIFIICLARLISIAHIPSWISPTSTPTLFTTNHPHTPLPTSLQLSSPPPPFLPFS